MSSMAVRRQYLPYTNFIFRLNAEMVGEPFIESNGHANFVIIKSPLKGHIVGGPIFKIPWGE